MLNAHSNSLSRSSPILSISPTSPTHTSTIHVVHLGQSLTNLPIQSQSVFTCGEDGFVRAWKLAEEGGPVQAGSARSRPKKEKKDRFKPY